jgi:hypothetical protein
MIHMGAISEDALYHNSTCLNFSTFRHLLLYMARMIVLCKVRDGTNRKHEIELGPESFRRLSPLA